MPELRTSSAEALEEMPFPADILVEPCRAVPKQYESLGPQLPLGVEASPSLLKEESRHHFAELAAAMASEMPEGSAWEKSQLRSSFSQVVVVASWVRSSYLGLLWEA